MHKWFQPQAAPARMDPHPDPSSLAARESGGAPFSSLVGDSELVRELKRLLARIAASPADTVLLLGESGTGKGLIASEIHRWSRRRNRPFQLVCCSALPESLLESELFGHEAGAFTDARRRKLGLVEAADGGTLFLDEIGELSLGLQVKLLSFLESRSFRRVGGTEAIDVDVRIVAATNRHLAAAVRDGAFRSDLFYRLNVLPVRVPPLRQRLDDLPLLVRHFVDLYNERYDTRVSGVSRRAMETLAGYRWPGNVRELRNLVERAMLLADGPVLSAEDFRVAPAAVASPERVFDLPPEGVDLPRMEAELIAQAMERTGGNKRRAGELLGLSRHQVHYRARKLGLEGGNGASAPVRAAS